MVDTRRKSFLHQATLGATAIDLLMVSPNMKRELHRRNAVQGKNKKESFVDTPQKGAFNEQTVNFKVSKIKKIIQGRMDTEMRVNQNLLNLLNLQQDPQSQVPSKASSMDLDISEQDDRQIIEAFSYFLKKDIKTSIDLIPCDYEEDLKAQLKQLEKTSKKITLFNRVQINHQIKVARAMNKNEEALLWSIKYNLIGQFDEIMQRCLNVNLNYCDSDGNTLISIAIQCGHSFIFNKLMQGKADVNIPNNEGNTPLHYALVYGHTDFADKLIEADANQYAVNNKGQTIWENILND